MEDGRCMDDFVIEIEDNAFSSLSHGIEHFLEDDSTENLKFTILHIFHALELILKARLAQEHPILIYTKPESKIDDNAKTVYFDTLIGRLKNVGVNLDDNRIKELKKLQSVRNSIEHHRINKSKAQVKDYIGRVAKFLDVFLEKEMNIILKEKLSEDNYRALADAIYSYEELLRKANDEIEKLLPCDDKERHGQYDIILCPTCLEDTLVIPDPRGNDSKTKCFYCEEEYDYEACCRCGDAILSRDDEGDFSFCRNCWNDMMSSD